MLELLADRALEGLSEEEERELAELIDRCPADEDPETFDVLAAELCVASIRGEEEVPERLQRRIREALARQVASASTGDNEIAPPRTSTPARMPSQVGWSEITAWFAAALSLAVAVSLATRSTGRGTLPTPLALRTSMLEEAEDVVRAEWQAGPTAPDVPDEFEFGEVVWSPSRQEGYMRFRGLPVNDPTREQYQLWIFDATRNEAHPVDGGVFDVTAGGEIVVAVKPKLLVREATLFAVTVERPGGVVVSDRSRLPLLAQVPTGAAM